MATFLPVRGAACALSVFAFSLPCIAGFSEVRPIALTGTDGLFGPGLGAGVTFSAIGQQQIAINDAGQAVFRGIASDNTSQGLWFHTMMSGNALRAVGGSAMPGGGTFPTGTSIINSPTLNNAGHVAFRLGAQSGLFSDTGAGTGRIVLSADAVPGAGGALYATNAVASGSPLFNQAGQTGYIGLFAANTTSTPPVVITGATANAQAIMVGNPGAGNQSIMVRQNDALLALDASGETRVGSFSNLTMSFNNAGHFVTLANLQGANVTTGTGAAGNSTMVITNRSGSIDVLARAGSPAVDGAGMPSATDRYRTFGSGNTAFNNAGRVAFSATLKDAAGVSTSAGALFSDAGSGTLRQIARAGEALPASITNATAGEFAGVTWGSGYNNLALNSAGDLAFQASALGNTGGTSNTSAIFRLNAADGSLTKVQRNSDVAIPGGAPDLSDVRFLNAGNIQMNDAGHMAFSATLTGTGVSVGLGNGSAIFAVDVDGTMSTIARTGDLFQVAPGDLRTITSIGGLTNSGGQDGRAMQLNALGQLAVQLDFFGGSSGVFVFTIPTPGASGMLLTLGLMAARRRRR